MGFLDRRHIWIGPSIKKIGLSKNTIFKGIFPKHIKQFLEENKINGLMIPVEKLSIANKDRKEKGNMYDELEKRLIKKLGGR